MEGGSVRDRQLSNVRRQCGQDVAGDDSVSRAEKDNDDDDGPHTDGDDLERKTRNFLHVFLAYQLIKLQLPLHTAQTLILTFCFHTTEAGYKVAFCPRKSYFIC